MEQPEVDALILSIADVDLDAPEPSDGPEPWPPMRLDEAPPVEPFPLDVLPAPAVGLVEAGAKAIGCPPDYLAVAAIATGAGAIGRSVSLKLKDGYFVPASLFACLVGPPSDGKTPALDAASEPLRSIGQALAEQHQAEMERWEAECADLAADPKTKKQKPPAPPKARRIDIDDTTMEAIPPILEANPRGIIMIKDELSGLLTGANQYKGGKGNDRQVWLNIWSGTGIVKDRVGAGRAISIRCPHPLMTIVGGMQPDMLGELVDAKGRSDGLVERFLFTVPDQGPVPRWTRAGIAESVAKDWADVVERLWALQMNVSADGRSVPHAAFMDTRAEAEWDRLVNDHIDEMNDPEFPAVRRAMWGKFKDHAGRLALVLALIRHAADPTVDHREIPRVSADAVRDAWRLVAYFKSHYIRARSAMTTGPAGPDQHAVKAIIAWVRAKGLTSFTESHVQQRFKDRKANPISDEDRMKALVRLAALNVIRPVRASEDQSHRRPGRPRAVEYEVNPAIHAEGERTP